MDLDEYDTHEHRYSLFTDLRGKDFMSLYSSLVLVTKNAECPCKTISYSFAKYSS